MFEYICERIIPGCGHQDRDQSREALLERVAIHLKERHDLDDREDRIASALKQTGITFINPGA